MSATLAIRALFVVGIVVLAIVAAPASAAC
jgi:hypothetical protein